MVKRAKTAGQESQGRRGKWRKIGEILPKTGENGRTATIDKAPNTCQRRQALPTVAKGGRKAKNGSNTAPAHNRQTLPNPRIFGKIGYISRFAYIIHKPRLYPKSQNLPKMPRPPLCQNPPTEAKAPRRAPILPPAKNPLLCRPFGKSPAKSCQNAHNQRKAPRQYGHSPPPPKRAKNGLKTPHRGIPRPALDPRKRPESRQIPPPAPDFEYLFTRDILPIE